eukprot:1142052-Pelagomonas_calceolata.AAC.2
MKPQKEDSNGDLEGYWKHPAPKPGCEKYNRLQWHVFASEFIGALVVKSQLFKVLQGVLSVADPINTKKDGVESHNFCINEFAE